MVTRDGKEVYHCTLKSEKFLQFDSGDKTHILLINHFVNLTFEMFSVLSIRSRPQLFFQFFVFSICVLSILAKLIKISN